MSQVLESHFVLVKYLPNKVSVHVETRSSGLNTVVNKNAVVPTMQIAYEVFLILFTTGGKIKTQLIRLPELILKTPS